MNTAWTQHGRTYQALEGIRNITVVLLNQNRTCPLDIISLFLKTKKNCQSMFHITMCVCVGGAKQQPLASCQFHTHVVMLYLESDVQVCHQRFSSAFDLLLIFRCSLIQILTLTPPPNNALLANMDALTL